MGRFFEYIKKGTNRPKGLLSYIVGKKAKRIIIKFCLTVRPFY